MSDVPPSLDALEALVPEPSRPLDPMGDGARMAEAGVKKNYAKVGSARPSSLLYTYGPGAIMDLPHFTVMPSGLDDWDAVWKRRDGIPTIHAPRLLEVVRMMLGPQVAELRPFPRQPNLSMFSREGSDLGVPARVFPQWMRCTGCDRLAPISSFSYRNTHPFRTDEAIFEHEGCRGKRRAESTGATKAAAAPRKGRRQPVVTARYLLACPDGHLDEFPYDWWVHDGARCSVASDSPALYMTDHNGGRGASATIHCRSCEAKRPMNQAQGQAGKERLPQCRGRLPHLDGFVPGGCANEARLMLVGAANLWFPAVQSIIDMPRLDPAEKARDDADRLRVALGDQLVEFGTQLNVIRALLRDKVDVSELSDSELGTLIALAKAPGESDGDRRDRRERWDPVDLLVPEWRYLKREPAKQFHEDRASGLTLSPRFVDPAMAEAQVSRVLAVDRLRKVNAIVGFTRIDEMDRINDLSSRLVPLTRTARPTWAVATEDRGEGVFLQLDEDAVAEWETRTEASSLWEAHRASHWRNFERRFSETADAGDPDSRLRPARYWLLHTLAHVLIREMAMSAGYGAASLTERIYAWSSTSGEAGEGRPPAAGLMICTTASDSDGTLGGLVRLSDPSLLGPILTSALRHAGRCSSDPVCAVRTPKDPEDFLHGAACHCCVMASETSCERANRFLDRRFLVSLPGSDGDLAFFGSRGQ